MSVLKEKALSVELNEDYWQVPVQVFALRNGRGALVVVVAQ